MYVCMYVSMYLCMYVYMYVCRYDVCMMYDVCMVDLKISELSYFNFCVKTFSVQDTHENFLIVLN